MDKDLRARIKRDEREAHAAALRRLRAAVAEAAARKRAKLTEVSTTCNATAERLRQESAQLRGEVRRVAAQRRELRAECRDARDAARAVGAEEHRTARQKVADERREQRIARMYERPADRPKLKGAGARKVAERRSEELDAARAEIDPKLLPVFEQVRRSLRPGARLSLAEAFAQWVEENPSEVWAILDAEAEKHNRRDQRQRRRAELAAVPF